jgi:hypothetical protein
MNITVEQFGPPYAAKNGLPIISISGDSRDNRRSSSEDLTRLIETVD